MCLFSLIQAWDAIMRGGSISAITYPSLNGAIATTEFWNILSIAVSCTTPNGHQRSNMKEVVQKLEETQILVWSLNPVANTFEIGLLQLATLYVLWKSNVIFFFIIWNHISLSLNNYCCFAFFNDYVSKYLPELESLKR